MEKVNLHPAYKEFLASLLLWKNYELLDPIYQDALLQLYLRKAVTRYQYHCIGINKYVWLELEEEYHLYTFEFWKEFHRKCSNQFYEASSEYPQYEHP